MLLNGMLGNTEVIYNLTESEITQLEAVDKCLLRQIFDSHSKTPIEAYYLECGIVPFRYIIKARRITFLHYLQNLKDNEMLK